MTKSAASHGGVVMVSIIFGTILVEVIKPGFPWLYNFFESFSLGFSDFVNQIFGIHTYPSAFISIFAALLIGIVWGMGYGLARHRATPKYGRRA